MLSRIIAAPFIIMALLALYFAWEKDPTYAVYVAPPAVILALIYTLSPQIDWWWYKRRPPKIDPMVETLFNKYFTFYKSLGTTDKKKFRNRVTLFNLSREYMPQGMENVPEDIKGLIASSAVWLTFGLEDYLLSKFEQIILYQHPFPSPQHPEKFHASEIYEEDGVMMFSIEQFMLGYIQTKQYYHIGLHEFAKVFMVSFPDERYPSFGADFWEKLPQISGLKKESIEKFIGLPQDDILPVAIVHFFTHATRFKMFYPSEYATFQGIFKQDPIEAEQRGMFSAN